MGGPGAAPARARRDPIGRRPRRGHPDAEVSTIATVRLRPGVRPEVTSELRDAATLPVREARRRCLLDHLAELRDLVAEASESEVSIEFADEAAELVDVA